MAAGVSDKEFVLQCSASHLQRGGETECVLDSERCRWKFHEICIFPLCLLFCYCGVVLSFLFSCWWPTNSEKRKAVRRKFKSRFLSSRCFSPSSEHENIKESLAVLRLRKLASNDFLFLCSFLLCVKMYIAELFAKFKFRMKAQNDALVRLRSACMLKCEKLKKNSFMYFIITQISCCLAEYFR